MFNNEEKLILFKQAVKAEREVDEQKIIDEIIQANGLPLGLTSEEYIKWFEDNAGPSIPVFLPTVEIANPIFVDLIMIPETE